MRCLNTLCLVYQLVIASTCIINISDRVITVNHFMQKYMINLK